MIKLTDFKGNPIYLMRPAAVSMLIPKSGGLYCSIIVDGKEYTLKNTPEEVNELINGRCINRNPSDEKIF